MMRLKPGNVFNKKYRILKFLGSGGMADVYQVLDLDDERVKALKVLKQSAAEGNLITHFQREFTTLHKLKHPQIVPVFDYGSTTNGDIHFTMEYVEGNHLGLISELRDPENYLPILLKILSTLQFIHAKGFVHGDIKPQNIILKPDGESLILTDFGMVEEINLYREGPVLGTLQYMSPEMIRGSGVDQRSDLYSLGIMSYEILSGIQPFQAAEPLTILRQHLEKTPQKLLSISPDCPEYLSIVIMKCLEKKPLDRYQSADEIIKEIGRNRPDLVEEESLALRECYILTSEFVGRKKELEYLVHNLELSLGGSGQTVVIGGETGIGKKRLINEFKIHCQLEKLAILHAHCVEKEARPHQTMVTLCHQLILSIDRKHHKLFRKYASELLKLSPEYKKVLHITDSLDDLRIDPSIERTRFFDALTQLFIEVSRITPLVIIIENLHWVDQVTLGILQYLIRNLGKSYIMICGTYQSEIIYSTTLMGKKDQLELLLEEYSDNQNFHDIHLEALRPGDVASMIGSMLGMAFKPEEFGKGIYEETGGNPFIITEVMKQLVKDNIIYREKGEWIIDVDDMSALRIPTGVRDIFQRRLERLSPGALKLLDFLVIPQKGMDYHLLAVLSDEEERVLFEKIYELLNLELIISNGTIYEFSNPIVREIIYEALTPLQKIELHATYGALLEKSTTNVENIVNELAYHFVKGNKLSKALHYSVIAAEISERVYAHEQAAEHYERAYILANRENIQQISEFLRKLVELYMMIGNYSLAQDKLKELFSLAKENSLFSREQICELNRKMASIHQKMGQYHKALKFLYDGLALLSLKDSPLVRAQLNTNLGDVYMLLGDSEKALSHCRTSLEIVEPLGNLKELSEIYNTYGKIYFTQRQLDEAMHFFKKSLLLREKIGDSLGIGRTYSNLGVISEQFGNTKESEDYYLSGLKIFEKIGFMYGSATIYSNLGLLYHQQRTDWEKGINYLVKALELHERTGNEFGQALTMTNLGFIYKDLGEYEKAESEFDRALELHKKLNIRDMTVSLNVDQASLYLDMGRNEEAIELLIQCREYIESNPVNQQVQTDLWNEISRYYFNIGDYEKAKRRCQKAMLLAKKFNQSEAIGFIRWLEAQIYEKIGDSLSQETALLESIDILEKEGSVFQLAKSYWSLGKYYHLNSNDHRAIEYIQKSRDIFQKIGVRSYYEDAQDLLMKMRERVLPDLFKISGDQGDIATLYRVSHDIISTLELPELLETILDAAIKTVNAERGLLILYDDKKNAFEVRAARNMDKKTQDDMATVSSGVVQRSVIQGIPIISTNASLDPRFKTNQSVIIFNIKSILCVPLKIKEKVIGVCYLDNRALTHQFTEKDLDFLSVLANQAAISIDNALLFERLKSATDNLNVGIIVMEKNGHIVSCNNKAAHILHLDLDVLHGYRYQKGDRSVFFPEIADLLLHSLETNEMLEQELRVNRSDKEFIIIDLSTSFLYDGFGEPIGVLCIFRDITTYKAMQLELDHQKRMTAIGDLATKISHRMKSYLAGIRILSEQLLKEIQGDDLKSEYINEILLEVEESERYVLHELSPQQISFKGGGKIEVNKVVKEIIMAIQKECQSKSIEISLDLSPELPNLTGDPVQVREVVNNLIINALQAIQKNGHIHISTTIKNDEMIMSIEDDGPGISDEIKEKIFEPFFTTKEEGSGVGLWVAHSIVANAGGKITVHSAAGVGTVFSIRLPISNPSYSKRTSGNQDVLSETYSFKRTIGDTQESEG